MLHADERSIILRQHITPSRPFLFNGEEVIGEGYTAIWFLLKDEPFDIGRFYRPDGSWTGMYVDILEPVRWDGSDPTTLRPLVDLFLDLWIAPDRRFQVLDEDEFEAARAASVLSPEQVRGARSALSRLIRATQTGAFPPPAIWAFTDITSL